jgi:hypothetical protein
VHIRAAHHIFVPQDRIVYLSELYFADQFLFINDGFGLDWLRALDAVAGATEDQAVAAIRWPQYEGLLG